MRGPADRLLFGIERALERVQLGFTIADVNGTILYSNPADARMHGYEVEAQLRRAQKMEAVGQLTGGIAHDVNNILTVIMANAELIASSKPSGVQEDRSELQELTTVALWGRATIKRLMGICRQAKLAPEPLDPAQVVNELMPSIRSLLPDNVEERHTIGASLPNIHADRGAVEQILLNLVTNARDAMVDGGVLRVEARRASLDASHRSTRGWGDPGEYVCVTVSDTGVGKGTGLGMSVVYGFMKQLQGFVDVESEVGKGQYRHLCATGHMGNTFFG